MSNKYICPECTGRVGEYQTFETNGGSVTYCPYCGDSRVETFEEYLVELVDDLRLEAEYYEGRMQELKEELD